MVKVRKKIVPLSKFPLKCPYPMEPEGICVHNTYNDAAAENEIAYMSRTDAFTSFHYAIDDIEAVQGVEENRNAFHAGDGMNGTGNRKYIGIEICYSKSGGEKYKKAERNAIVFIAQKLRERGWKVDKVKKHQDFSGKYCPHRILDEGRWNAFIAAINAELNPVVKKEVTIVEETPKKVEYETVEITQDVHLFKLDRILKKGERYRHYQPDARGMMNMGGSYYIPHGYSKKV